MADGAMFYCASALSEYRVHPGQEQRSRGMGLDCITERVDLVQAARGAGYLAKPAQHQVALMRVDALAKAWRQRPGLTAAQAAELDGVVSSVGSELARLASQMPASTIGAADELNRAHRARRRAPREERGHHRLDQQRYRRERRRQVREGVGDEALARGSA